MAYCWSGELLKTGLREVVVESEGLLYPALVHHEKRSAIGHPGILASCPLPVEIPVMVGGRIRQTAGDWFPPQFADRVHWRSRHDGDPILAASDFNSRNPSQ
jgi:hypothetical protein